MSQFEPEIKKILAAKIALRELLDSSLLRSPSAAEFLVSIPSEEEFETTIITNSRIEDLTYDTLGYLNMSIWYLFGMLTGVPLDEIPEQVEAIHLKALLSVSLAFELRAEQEYEYKALLAHCQKKASSLK